MKLGKVMEMFKRFLLILLLDIFALTVVSAQSQSGFISLDCGLPGDSPPYIEATTGINYTSDSNYVENGIGKSVQPEFRNTPQQMWNVRSFPDGVRNCYRLNLTWGDRYLIRASFLYGNYDGQNTIPKFDLYLGPDLWTTVTLQQNAALGTFLEVIHVLSSDDLCVCLVNTGSGTPFISALELRLLRNDTYVTKIGSLENVVRLDMGGSTKTYRFKDDVYDRAWAPYNFNKWRPLTTGLRIDANRSNSYQPAPAVMSTAVKPVNDSEPLDFYIASDNPNSQFYVYMHFAEVEKLKAYESRQFNISVNGRPWFGLLTPDYLFTTTVFSRVALSGAVQYNFSIFKTGRSTHPPIINALEVYMVKELLQSQTDQQEVDAITNIKVFFHLEKNWQGDPCVPQAFMWEGVNCADGSDDPPRITSLNLSSSGLTGGIPSYLINLTLITSLDLSDNNLTGPVPSFLSQLTSLTYLNLERNKLSGSLPVELIEKRDNNSLTLRVDGNPGLCHSISCKKEKNKIIIPAVTSAAASFILITALVGWWTIRRRKQKARKVDSKSITSSTYESMEWNSRQFSYSEVLKITNNFEKVLGKGGFGTVYHGYTDNTEVAVKMLSQSSVQGYMQFQAEVKLLLRVHHRHLTTLVGFCDEATNMALIYEYMANGNLGEHLSDGSKRILNWEERLRIAVEAAQGLEYLHHECKPPIVHRDVKSTNILLNDKLEGKLADFGLSRTFPVEGVSHVSTIICGTPGYLDPEYYVSNRLTEKSDVYSFGVVLLEIITGRPVISKSLENGNTHISEWVCFMLSKGDIRNTADPRLEGDFDINSVWKAVEIAMVCVSSTSTRRPTMNHAVVALNECLATEIARKKEGRDEYEAKGFTEMIAVDLQTVESPLAR